MFISVAAEDQIVVSNKRTQDKVYRARRVQLPLRKDFQDNKDIASGSYILGVSAPCRVLLNGRWRFPLLQRDKRAPSNPGKWTCPGGMCSGYPEEVVQEELLQELGIVSYSNDSSTLTVLLPVIVDGHLADKPLDQIIEMKQWQEKHIRNNLPSKYQSFGLQYRQLLVRHVSATSSSRPVYLKLPSDSDFKVTKYLAAVDTEVRGVTLCLPLEAELLNEGEYYLIDPEPFNRNTRFSSISELSTLSCTPSLSHVFKNLSFIRP